MSWLIYALGGGWGHCQRAMSLARAAAERGHDVEILANSPFAKLFLEPAFSQFSVLPRVRWKVLEPYWTFADTRAAVLEHLAAAQPDLFVVDTFPRGLGGELVEIVPRLRVPRVWVHRALDPAYVAQMNLAAFAANFELILLPGEDAALQEHPRAVRTEPWLISDAHELVSRDFARRFLRVESDLPVVLVPTVGKPSEFAADVALVQRLARELEGRCEVRFASFHMPDVDIAPAETTVAWPLMALLPGVDLVVGAGGYNTVHECRAAGVPLLATPRQRKYDMQELRLKPEELAPPNDQLAAEILKRLAAATRRTPPSYTNGVHAAVEAIERIADQHGSGANPT